MTLKYPIKLSSSVRDADGIPLALAKTEDGGSIVVSWKNFSWSIVPEDSFSVSDVMRSPEALEEQLIEWGIIDNKNEPSRLSANKRQLEMLKKLTPDQIDKAIDRGLYQAAIDSTYMLFKKYIKSQEVKFDPEKAMNVLRPIVQNNLDNLEENRKQILEAAFTAYSKNIN